MSRIESQRRKLVVQILSTTLIFNLGGALGVVSLRGADPYLVKDIHASTGSASPRNLTRVGDRLFFTADDGVHGRELWTSDGTEEGTRLVADISPGAEGAFVASGSMRWAPAGNLCFFPATDPENGPSLWVSNGAEEGTRQLKSIPWEADNAGFLAPVDDRVFFVAAEPELGEELWVTDGTESGTRIVRDIVPGSTGSDPWNLTASGSRLFFTARENEGDTGRGLWTTDGTEAGTRFVKGGFSGYPDRLTPVGDRLFFSCVRGVASTLWVSDGTEAGTRSILPPEAAHTWFGFGPYCMTGLGERLFFVAETDLSGEDLALWVSDGSDEGTKTISTPERCEQLVAAGDRLFFAGGDHGDESGNDSGELGLELWTSDGTDEGTRLVKDIHPGGRSGLITAKLMLGSGLTPVGGRLFFLASDGESGGIWVSDGTGEGTRRVTGIFSPFLGYGLAVGGRLLYPGGGGGHGEELWALPLASLVALFRRGEVNGDAAVDLTDTLRILNTLFLGADPPGCLDAADTDDTGHLDLTDAVYLLVYLFCGGPAPPPPFSNCGVDATADGLGCASSPACE
jgi:ELWxxDGT repeat protein